jgi:hypothetical protein
MGILLVESLRSDSKKMADRADIVREHDEICPFSIFRHLVDAEPITCRRLLQAIQFIIGIGPGGVIGRSGRCEKDVSHSAIRK